MRTLTSSPLSLSSILAFFLFLFISTPTLQSIIREYDIKDLEIKDDESRFQADASFWGHTALDGTNTKPYASCSQRYLMGGRGVLANNPTTGAKLWRTYQNLPTHTTVYFTAHLWFMKGWSNTESLTIQFDSKTYTTFSTPAGNLLVANDGTDQCSGTWMADVGLVRIYGYFAHSAPTLTATFTTITSKNAYAAAFGIRNITFSFAAAAPTIIVAPICGIFSKSTQTSAGNPLYVTGPVINIPAVPPTGTPAPAISPACRCSEGMFWDPPSPTAVPVYLGACLTCHMSCFSCFGPTAKHCLACQEGYRFDGTACVSCGTLCTTCITGAGGIIDSDGACKECTDWNWNYMAPSLMGHIYQLQLSPYTCNLDSVTITKLLAGMPSDPKIFPVSNFTVSKTSDNSYLVEIAFEKSLVFTTDVEVTMNYLNTTLTIPRKFVASPTLQNLKDTFFAFQIILMVILGLSLFGTIAVESTATLWSFMNLLQFTGYLRFLSIEYPKLIERFFELGKAADFSLIPNLFGLMTSSVSEGILPSTDDINMVRDILPAGVFIHQQEVSYFIYNAGGLTLATFFIFIVALIIVAVSGSSGEGQSLIMKSLRGLVKWNFLLRYYLMTGLPIAIAVLLQLRFFYFDTTYQTVCSVFTIFMGLYMIAMFIIMIRILQSNENSYLIKGRIRKVFGTLYVGMAIDKSSGKHYHLLVFLRNILIAMLIGFVETIPFLQISLLIYYNIGIVYYLFQQAIFTDPKLQTVSRVKELLVLLTEVWILCINVQVSSIVYYDVLQWFIITTHGSALVIELFYLVGQQMVGGGIIVAQMKKFWQFLRVCCKKVRDPPQRGRTRNDRERNQNDETAID